ncbi:MAG TPA: phosphatase PAP2/dual specificity phosphatase family protein [Chthoniobacterales bacterium]|nr:phosphatase PAP2/dual specificity phosphatase family protein [Chthoniobacterales bacterium]
MRLNALRTSALLAFLFLVIYGGTNWLTALRPGVPTFFFEWERSIPFVPLMIVPYMSINLFFLAAPFFCRDERELATFSKRLITALFVGGICFLAFPLRFAFPRPHAGGWLGTAFDWFQLLDKPYNLVPSLHITMLFVLGTVYARHGRIFWRVAAISWFVLIGFSAVLTYQHHILDVVAGFALAAYCFYFIRESEAPHPPVIANRRVGFYYAIGAVALTAAAFLFLPLGLLLFWPAIALAITASAYFGVGPGIFNKTEGRLPWSTWWVLGPCLFGQRLSLLYYRRESRAWDEVTPQVWMGRVLNRREAAAAVRSGVTAVLDLSAEFSEAAPFRSITYRNIPVLDLTAPTRAQLQEMAAFIDEQAQSGVVYVHCKIGYSRTAAAVAAYLLHAGEAGNVSEAIAILRQVRPRLVVRPEILAALSDFERSLARVGSEIA